MTLYQNCFGKKDQYRYWLGGQSGGRAVPPTRKQSFRSDLSTNIYETLLFTYLNKKWTEIHGDLYLRPANLINSSSSDVSMFETNKVAMGWNWYTNIYFMKKFLFIFVFTVMAFASTFAQERQHPEQSQDRRDNQGYHNQNNDDRSQRSRHHRRSRHHHHHRVEQQN